MQLYFNRQVCLDGVQRSGAYVLALQLSSTREEVRDGERDVPEPSAGALPPDL